MKTIIFASVVFTIAAQAEIPETYRKLWSDPAVAGRIERDIEQHRKGDATIEVIGQDGKPLANVTVEVRQRTHEFLFGCNLFVLDQLATPELNAKYERAFINLFNFATVPFYWGDLEPVHGKPRYAEDSPRVWRRPPPDRLLKWCKAHGITPKGHALIYAKNVFMPDWTARNDPATFQRQVAQHMAELAARYRHDIPIWDAENEEIPRLKHLDQWHAVPKDYLAWCFQEADGLFPKSTKLLINDGLYATHDTTSDYLAMVTGLQQRGVRVDGIGMQFHSWDLKAMIGGKPFPPTHLSAVYDRLGQTGLPLYITEITIPGTGADGPALQAAIAANLFRLWFSTPMMAGVTWWNLGDGTAHVDENKALGGLLDQEMNPKPAYVALDQLINHEWKTNLTLTTDATGKASFRGFLGKYVIGIAFGAEKREFPFELKSHAGTSREKLTVN